MQTAPVAIAAIQGIASPGQGRSGEPSPTSEVESASSPDSAANPYLSPVIRLDNQSGLVILQYRDKSSGEAQDQIPSANVVRQYQERAVAADRAALANTLAGVAGGRPAASGTDAASVPATVALGSGPAPGSFAPAADSGGSPPAPAPSAAPAPTAPAGGGSQLNALI